MKFEIKSKTVNRSIAFYIPEGGEIHVKVVGDMMGNRICDGGRFHGDKIKYTGGDHEEFAKICRRWYRARINWMRTWRAAFC
ncbi:MAG: hypothetical protein FWF12_00300 [Betaproteobacteria bacterium]|nr:hypothetical protein [Betaproteobacteria bacterium]